MKNKLILIMLATYGITGGISLEEIMGRSFSRAASLFINSTRD